MSLSAAQITDALIALTPELLALGRDLLSLVNDEELARAEIVNRRDEIRRRREVIDEALVAKYKKG